MYNLLFEEQATEDLIFWNERKNKSIANKLKRLFEELVKHPTSGTGKPEKLKNNLSGCWSRRITIEHRLTYIIREEIKTIMVLKCKGHYV